MGGFCEEAPMRKTIETQAAVAPPDRTQSTQPVARLSALDGLRGLAALTVLLFHVENYGFKSQVLGHGYLAVDLFFLLSGFVISAAYEKRLGRDLHPLRFMIEVRLVRLYPMLVVGVLAGAGAALVVALTSGGGLRQLAVIPFHMLLQLIFVPELKRGTDLFPLCNMQWSLFFELIVANLGHALVLRRLQLRGLAITTGLGAVLAITTAIYFGSLQVGFDLRTFWGGLGRVAFSYPLGVLLYRLHEAHRLPTAKIAWPLPAALLLASFIGGYAMTGPTSILHDLVVVGLAFPVILVAAIGTQLPARVVGPAAALGGISYPLYSIQDQVLRVRQVSGSMSFTERVVLWTTVCLFALALSWALSKYYDERMRKVLTRALRLPFRTPAVTAP